MNAPSLTQATKEPREGSGIAARNERPSPTDVLDSCSMFFELDIATKLNICDKSNMAYAERGELIWLADQPARFAGIVAVGYVKLTHTTPEGTEVAVELLSPGLCFGAMAALGDRVDALSAIAVTNAWYLKVPSQVLFDVYGHDSAFRERVFQSVLPRIRRAHTMISRLSHEQPQSRLAAVLLLISDSHGAKSSKGIALDSGVNLQTLSEMAGTTLETAAQLIREWTEAGFIASVRSRITIVDFGPLYVLAREG